MGFLKEASGEYSATRLIFMIGSLWSMAICTFLSVSAEMTPGELIATFAALEGVFVGLKLGQKPMEQNK